MELEKGFIRMWQYLDYWQAKQDTVTEGRGQSECEGGENWHLKISENMRHKLWGRRKKIRS